MPEISRFFGIVVTINYRDHAPPHFHVQHGDEEVLIDIQKLTVVRGSLSARSMALVKKWAALHQSELLEAWNDAQTHHTPRKIEPLSSN